MEISTVISTPPEDARVSNVHDEGEFSNRRLRIDFGTTALFIRCSDVPEFRAELLKVWREILDETFEDEAEWIKQTSVEYVWHSAPEPDEKQQ